MVHLSLLFATVPPVSSTAFPIIDSRLFLLVLLSTRQHLNSIAPALFHIIVPWICTASWWLCPACIESARYLKNKLYLVTYKQFSLNWVNQTIMSIPWWSVLRISIRSNILLLRFTLLLHAQLLLTHHFQQVCCSTIPMSNRRMVPAPVHEGGPVGSASPWYLLPHILLTRHLDTSKNQQALSARHTENSCERATAPQLFFDCVS